MTTIRTATRMTRMTRTTSPLKISGGNKRNYITNSGTSKSIPAGDGVVIMGNNI